SRVDVQPDFLGFAECSYFGNRIHCRGRCCAYGCYYCERQVTSAAVVLDREFKSIQIQSKQVVANNTLYIYFANAERDCCFDDGAVCLVGCVDTQAWQIFTTRQTESPNVEWKTFSSGGQRMQRRNRCCVIDN